MQKVPLVSCGRLYFFILACLALFITGCQQETQETSQTAAQDKEEPDDVSGADTARNAELILITGITGRQGSALAAELDTRGFPLRGLSRDISQPESVALYESGIEMVEGDFGEPDSLKAAMQGMHGVFLVTPNVPEQVIFAQNVIDAAHTAGIRYILYTSNQTAHPEYVRPDTPKAAIERMVRESGIDYTILRPVTFMENFSGMQDQIAATGLRDPRKPDTKQQFISVRDIAFFAAEAFEQPKKWNGREENIASDELTNLELAALFSRIMEIPVNFKQISWEEWSETAPPRLVEIYRWYEEGDVRVDIASLRKEYPNLMTFERYLRETGWGKSE